MGEIDELGKGRYKRRDVGRSMEERGVLLDEEVGHFPRAILCRLFSSCGVMRRLQLRLVEKLLLFTRLRVNDGWEEGIWSVGHMEGKRLNMATYPGERLNARRLGES